MTTEPPTGQSRGAGAGTTATDVDADGMVDTDADGTTDAGPATARYRVAVDRDACDGVFACLVRDDRFVESADGLADFAVDEAESVDRTAGADGAGRSDGTKGTVTATFADDRIDDARAAETACPLDAITVSTTTTDGDAVDEPTADDAPEGP